MEGYRRFLLPEVIAKIKGIDLKARLVVEGFLSGLHKSPYKGFSVEFADYRSYIPGDELKRIDWKVFARTERFWVREYEEETNLRAYLLLDASGSMEYKSKGITKFEYACYLTASFAYLLLKQHDSIGLAVFNKDLINYIPPRYSPFHLSRILKTLDQTKPKGETNLEKTFMELGKRIKKRGLIILLSDLFDEKERVLNSLKHFRHKKHEVLVFHILDPKEVSFDFDEPRIFRDLETHKEITIDPRTIKREYQEAINRTIKEFRQECREHFIDYNVVFTSLPFDYALLLYLEKRARF